MSRLKLRLQVMNIHVIANSNFDTLYLQGAGGMIALEHSVRKGHGLKVLDMVEVTMHADVFTMEPAFK